MKDFLLLVGAGISVIIVTAIGVSALCNLIALI